MKDIRVALAMTRSPVGQTRRNLEMMANWIQAAKTEGADIVCFPELNITGYLNTAEITGAAESISGSTCRRLSRMAADVKMVILAGMIEKGPSGDVFASHLVVRPDGFVGPYRKLHIAPFEQEVFAGGEAVSIFQAAGTKIGIQLCYDTHFPELSTAMALKGAEVLFFPHASPRGSSEEKFSSWMRHMTARAYDNGIYVLACNQVGENEKGLVFPGLAVAIDPSGRIVKKDTGGLEGLLVADLKAAVLRNVRSHPMRFFLPSRRPELYK